MQKKDMKTGVVYGYAKGTSDYRQVSPVIVLDTLRLWYRDRYSHTWVATAQAKYSSDWRGETGYLVLSVSNFGPDEDKATALANAKALAESFAGSEVTAEAVNSWASIVRAMEGVSLVVVNNRWIVGDYENAKQNERDRDRARELKRNAERNEQRNRNALMVKIDAALSDRGFTHTVTTDHGRTFGGHHVSIRADVLASILGIELGES